MLLLVTGSSCAGKSTAARGSARLANLAVHDSDEHGVPSNADTAWRQRDLRRWVLRAIELDREGHDLLLTGQSPIGELLAVPEASRLDLAVCLLDVANGIRSQRLEQRDPGVWSPEVKGAFGNWARWHRGHAGDPAHAPEVITEAPAPGMRWERWLGWTRDEPRWCVETVDTTDRAVVETQATLRAWVERARGQRDEGSLPLARGWCP